METITLRGLTEIFVISGVVGLIISLIIVYFLSRKPKQKKIKYEDIIDEKAFEQGISEMSKAVIKAQEALKYLQTKPFIKNNKFPYSG